MNSRTTVDKNTSIQLINSVRNSADYDEAGGLTFEEARLALDAGDVYDVEFWNAIEYAKAVFQALAGEEL
jgi:hypothetical protein